MKELKRQIERNNGTYKRYYDRHTRKRENFEEGEEVVYRKTKQWLPATVVEKWESPRSYVVNTGTNVVRRNSSQLRRRYSERKPESESEVDTNAGSFSGVQLTEPVSNNNSCSERSETVSFNVNNHSQEGRPKREISASKT